MEVDMILFLTSTLGENYIGTDQKSHACKISGYNGLLDNLIRFVPAGCRGVIMASDPDDYENNDSVLNIMRESFEMSGLETEELLLCDGRNADRAKELIGSAGLVIMAGGHVPTQNRFFEKIGLKQIMQSYEGVVVGISAGSMNCAGTVYAVPELDGEALDPEYKRYLHGLGLTDISILPHLQYLRGLELDGMRMVDDIAIADSRIRPFYGLNDGSYILEMNGTAEIYGEAYYFAGGCERRSTVIM